MKTRQTMEPTLTYAVKRNQALPSSGHRAVRKYPFDTMAINAILFVPNVTTQKFSTYVHTQGRKLGRKFKTQMATMRQDQKTQEWEVCAAGLPGAVSGVAIYRVA